MSSENFYDDDGEFIVHNGQLFPEDKIENDADTHTSLAHGKKKRKAELDSNRSSGSESFVNFTLDNSDNESDENNDASSNIELCEMAEFKSANGNANFTLAPYKNLEPLYKQKFLAYIMKQNNEQINQLLNRNEQYTNEKGIAWTLEQREYAAFRMYLPQLFTNYKIANLEFITSFGNVQTKFKLPSTIEAKEAADNTKYDNNNKNTTMLYMRNVSYTFVTAVYFSKLEKFKFESCFPQSQNNPVTIYLNRLLKMYVRGLNKELSVRRLNKLQNRQHQQTSSSKDQSQESSVLEEKKLKKSSNKYFEEPEDQTDQDFKPGLILFSNVRNVQMKTFNNDGQLVDWKHSNADSGYVIGDNIGFKQTVDKVVNLILYNKIQIRFD